MTIIGCNRLWVFSFVSTIRPREAPAMADDCRLRLHSASRSSHLPPSTTNPSDYMTPCQGLKMEVPRSQKCGLASCSVSKPFSHLGKLQLLVLMKNPTPSWASSASPSLGCFFAPNWPLAQYSMWPRWGQCLLSATSASMHNLPYTYHT